MNRTGVLALAALALGALVMIPAHAASRVGVSGAGSTTCGDGTVTWNPTTLWPPNHKMQTVSITYTAPATTPADPQLDTTKITVTGIVDNQANTDGTGEAPGSGAPTDVQGLDWSGIGNNASSAEGSPATTSVQVRSERSGLFKSGRTYTITVMCSESTAGAPMSTDPNGNGMATLNVTVPHDQGHH